MSKINTKDRRRKIRSLRRRHGDLCHWCHVKLEFDDEARWKPTLDHYIPRTHGGSNKIKNLVLACDWCNQKRGHKTPSQFRSWLRKHLVPPDQRRKRKL